MTASSTIYALLDAAKAALEQRDGATAARLAAMALRQQPDLLEAHHLAALASYFTVLGAVLGTTAPAGPVSSYDLTIRSGNLHLQVALTLDQCGHHELAGAAFRIAALLDFHLNPALRAGFSGPFNGQVLRTAAFRAIAAGRRLGEVVETGAFRGTTAEFMARHVSCPVKTTEIDPYFFEFTRLRFAELRQLGSAGADNLQLFALDSRAFLEELFTDATPPSGISFFYLDAHGDGVAGRTTTNPLTDELALIRHARPHCIVMIDDFNIPDDPAYYVEHGNTLQDLAAVLPRFDARFFPLAARHDSGSRRGCLVLSGSPDVTALLGGIAELRVAPGG